MSLSKSSINSEQNFTAPNSNNPCIYEFEDFRLDAWHLMLYKNGTTISLKPKVVETLVALVERPGEVISKDELMDRVWQGSFVEESNLSQNIYQLRKTLGTCAGGQPLIETFWRRGYRFNGEVRQSSDVEVVFATHTKTLFVTEEETIDEREQDRNGIAQLDRRPLNGTFPSRDLTSIPQTKGGLAKVLIGAAALILSVLLIFGGALFQSAETGPPGGADSGVAFSGIKMTRLTPDLNIDYAAISPDGRYLAYDVIDKGNYSLWIKDVASGSASQIMPANDRGYGALHFSPDGKLIYYNKFLESSPNGTIFRIPAFGGEPQAIARDVISSHTISPDGSQIAFVRGSHQALMIAQADGSGERILRTREGTTGSYETWDSDLSWSPDGTKIVICGSHLQEGSGRRRELIEVSVADGVERNIPIPDWNYVDDVKWLNDQSGLIVRARETEASPWQIWRVSNADVAINRVTNDLNNYDNLSLSGDSRLLVVRKHFTSMNIWTVPLDEPDQAKQVTFGNDANDGVNGIAFTPDGEIIYTSPRGGNVDLWATQVDGGEQRQLTKNAGGLNSRPRVTPDGRKIVFISSRTGKRQVWQMDMDGGNPSRLDKMTEGFEADLPVISPDGAWVYFTPFTSIGGFIAKIPTTGGEPVTVRYTGWPLSISPNGKLLVLGFYDITSSQPWKNGIMSLENGEMEKVLEEGFRFVGGWTADSKSLVVVRDKDRSNLWLQPIDGSEPRQLTKFDGGIVRSFAISPDFKRIAIARGNPSAEAVLITDF